jgi:hypothetical protein
MNCKSTLEHNNITLESGNSGQAKTEGSKIQNQNDSRKLEITGHVPASYACRIDQQRVSPIP